MHTRPQQGPGDRVLGHRVHLAGTRLNEILEGKTHRAEKTGAATMRLLTLCNVHCVYDIVYMWLLGQEVLEEASRRASRARSVEPSCLRWWSSAR